MSSWEGVQIFTLLEICICVQIYTPHGNVCFRNTENPSFQMKLRNVSAPTNSTNVPHYPKLERISAKHCVIKMLLNNSGW